MTLSANPTSQPEAGAAYSSDSSRARGQSCASQVDGQHASCAIGAEPSTTAPAGERTRRQVAKGPPRMPCTKTTSTSGASVSVETAQIRLRWCTLTCALTARLDRKALCSLGCRRTMTCLSSPGAHG